MIMMSDFWTSMLLALDFLLTMVVYVYTFPRRRSVQAAGAVMSFFYMPVMMAFICRTRNLSHGLFLYLLIYICASVSDVCALAVGMAIGRHKLAPVLSPKKTIEGAIGGIAGSALVSCLLALVVQYFEKGTHVLPLFLIIGICGSIIGQTGDLAASAIKRNNGIKDYGSLIPGHGGIMDRFDSVIMAAPAMYLFLMVYGLAVL
jgi:phosphatidate cytidylyltransferase